VVSLVSRLRHPLFAATTCFAAFLLFGVARAGVLTHTVQITSGPQGSTRATSADFTFTSTARSSFTCSLDGSTPSACATGITLTGSVSYTNLAYGQHTFTVVALSGGHTAQASRTWTIERPPPLPQVLLVV